MTTTAKRSVLCGLIGAGIQASRTPSMHETEGEAQGLRSVYQKIDVTALGLGNEALPELLTAAKRMGFAGLNITFPFKQQVIPLLDELSDEAASLNAVNTVVIKDGRMIGYNTDCSGYGENFRRGLPDAKRDKVVQMGAGGAGAAVAHALLSQGVQQLSIFDVDPAKARELADSLCARFGAGRALSGTDLAAAMAVADGLVNTTPMGMEKLPGTPVPAEMIRPALWVSEIVYFPLETELLRIAREKGCRTLNGGGMAVFQAVDAFRLFTGLEPDHERMLRHFAAMGS